MDEYEQWSGILNVKHVLFLYDACTAGEATIAKDGQGELRAAVTELSANGSRIVVTAGTAKQEAWVVRESSDSQYSIFTEALVRVLRDGTAESKRRGFITIGQAVEEAGALLADMTRHLGPGHEMNPDPVKIDRAHTGTFVFLNPHADRPGVPQGDILAMGITVPKGVGGANLDKEMELAAWKSIEPLDDPQLYTRFCEEFSSSLFCAAARKRIEKLKAAVSTSTSTEDLTKLNVAELRSRANQGSRDALTQLGKIYESGLQGAPIDLQASIEFYKRASDLGDGSASYRIGEIYYHGRKGVPREEEQAVSWYRKAASAGYALGMDDLGYMYRNGRGGLPKDEVQAVNWYRQAANAGDGRGMANLGFMYDSGRGGLPKDEAQALDWYRKAADAGNALGMCYLGFMYHSGPGALPKDEAQAVNWYRKAADAGNATCMSNLGGMYRDGLGGLPKDDAQAVGWYRKAADAGDESGMTNLGFMYDNGRGGLPKDEAQAVDWNRKAAELGDTFAQTALKRLGR